MSTDPDLDRVAFVTTNDKGDRVTLDLWTSLTIADDFLSPCQTVTMTVAADETRFDLTRSIIKGQQYRIEINDHPVCAGFVDAIEVTCDRGGGTVVTIEARDVLSPVVDSHADPRMAVAAEMSLDELADLLFIKQFDLPFTLFESNEKGRNLSLGKAVKVKAKTPRRALKQKLKNLKPHDNEGAFDYFLRFAHRNGYHCWAMPDGSGVVIGSPEYEQDPAYQLIRKRAVTAGPGAKNNIERGRARSDMTGVPSVVLVRGKGAKPGEKKSYVGCATNDSAPFLKAFYISDDESADQEHCETVARYVMGKAMRKAFTYEVTVRGCSDPETGRIYTVDTVADVDDEMCGVKGLMWVESRTFRKSRQGTFTDLRLLPADSLVMDWYVSDSPPPPPADYQAAAKKTKAAEKLPPFEERYASTWFAGLYATGPKKGT